MIEAVREQGEMDLYQVHSALASGLLHSLASHRARRLMKSEMLGGEKKEVKSYQREAFLPQAENTSPSFVRVHDKMEQLTQKPAHRRSTDQTHTCKHGPWLEMTITFVQWKTGYTCFL